MGELLGIARPAGDDTRETETGRNLQVISNWKSCLSATGVFSVVVRGFDLTVFPMHMALQQDFKCQLGDETLKIGLFLL